MMANTKEMQINKNEISSFTGKYEFLSNFLRQPVIFNDRAYKSAEHAFQAAKPLHTEVHNLIQDARTPRDARTIAQFCELRPDWHEVRIQVMEDVLRAKFSQPHLREKLLATGTKTLIEGNTWGDRFWGCEMEHRTWVGQNNLGKLLMKLREEFQAERKLTL